MALQEATERLQIEQGRHRQSTEVLKQAQGELQQAKVEVADTQRKLLKKEEYCHITEEALEETEEELLAEQQKCEKIVKI